MPGRERLLFTDPLGNLALEISEAPKLHVEGGNVYVNALPEPIAEVPEDLVYDSSIRSSDVASSSKYKAVPKWGTRPAFAKPTRVVFDTVLQEASGLKAVQKSLDPAVQSLVPGGVYIAQLTEQGGRGLAAPEVQRAIISQFGPPMRQYRLIYPNPDRVGEVSVDWIGVWRKPGGQTPRGPIISR